MEVCWSALLDPNALEDKNRQCYELLISTNPRCCSTVHALSYTWNRDQGEGHVVEKISIELSITVHETAREIFLRWLAALEVGNPQNIVALYAANAVFLPTMASGVIRGH